MYTHHRDPLPCATVKVPHFYFATFQGRANTHARLIYPFFSVPVCTTGLVTVICPSPPLFGLFIFFSSPWSRDISPASAILLPIYHQIENTKFSARPPGDSKWTRVRRQSVNGRRAHGELGGKSTPSRHGPRTVRPPPTLSRHTGDAESSSFRTP